MIYKLLRKKQEKEDCRKKCKWIKCKPGGLDVETNRDRDRERP